MTVTAAEARIEYAGNGTTLVFAYPYKFFQNDDLDVWLFDDTTDIGVEQVLGADYTVTGALNPSGGNVTMVVPPPGGHTLIIINSPDIVQTTHYVNADDFPADSHEQGLDRLTKICQRLSDRIDRAVRAPDYAPEDQVPDAATLVGLVEDAQEAADDSAASAADSASEASASQAAASQASDYASAAAGSAGLAAGSASNAASSAAQAASSAAQAEVNEVNWIGPWSASYQYKDNDAVSFAGSSWIALRSNINMQPDTHPADWDLLAAQGGAGPAGSGGGDMLRANNLSDLTAPTTARTNLGLGNSATLNVGTTPSTVAAGNDPRFGVIVSATAPAGAPPGTLWWESDSGLLYFRYDDGTSVQWVIACPQPSIDGFLLRAGDTMTGPLVLPGDPTTNLQAATKAYVDANTGASLLISDTPPVGAKDGSLWWESDTGTLYVLYNDGNSTQWVNAAPQPDTSVFATKPYADAYAPHGQCYLSFVSATQVQLSPKDGNSIKIGGLIYKIPSAGVVASNASLAANTMYLVYLYNNAGTLTLELSTTGHGPSSADGVECKNTDYTRTLVGMVYTNGAAQFQNSGAFLGVLSWFNRKLKYAQLSIGTFGPYGGAATITGGNPGIMANWGDEPTYAVLAAQASMSGTYAQILVALDGQGTLPHGATTYCYGPTAGAVNMAIFIGGWQQNAEGAHQYNAAGGATSGSGALSMFNGQINMATRG